MDDYNISTLVESKNEWCARLSNILTPTLIDGITSVFDEAFKICIDNDEEEKYLMTFQNLLNNIPKWSSEIVDTEKDRIIGSSGCNYLEDLLTCVHITQLKALTSSRAGLKQKKVNIEIPNVSSFIHKVYINIARKIYVNVYLFEKNILPLATQKNNRELELIVKECILNTIRENIPVENILKIYLDETQETDVEVEETREVVPDIETIEKMKKKTRDREITTMKQEVKANIQKESETNLKKALKEANKSFNMENAGKATSEESGDQESGEESENVTNYSTDDDEDSGKLKIASSKLDDDDLNIKTLDDDPDKLDMDILDLDMDILDLDLDKPEQSTDANIELDIEDL
tara:strand:- start:4014 stop:5057 length:1044 start_codon:yes stop_codon:yes gene_type:complete